MRNDKTFWLIFAVGVFLRVIWINVPPLWYDENFTILLARLPFADMLQATAADVHPPLWYAIEWALFHIAPHAPVWMIRFPALIFSVASLWLFARILRQMEIPPTVQLAAFLLMAVMPMQLWYAQEGRMYAMLEFFVLLAFSALLERDNKWLFVAVLGLLYTQNYGPFYVLAFTLILLVTESIKYITPYAALTSAGVLWLPWMTMVAKQMNDIKGTYWIVDQSLGAVLVTIYKLFLTASVPAEFFIASYLVTFVLLIVGCIHFVRSKHPQRASIAIMAFVPLLVAWSVSVVWQPVLLFRPLIGSSPFLYLIAAWSFEHE